MANCIRCNQQIDVNINFCPTCGEDQRVEKINEARSNTSFLTVLCILTIIGSVFTIGRAYLYEMVSMIGDGDSNYIRGWIYAGSSVGTMIGAIMMLQRKLLGLYLYSVSQALYIITVFKASNSYDNTFDPIAETNADSLLASGIAMFFIFPSVLFLILYWTSMVRKLLK